MLEQIFTKARPPDIHRSLVTTAPPIFFFEQVEVVILGVAKDEKILELAACLCIEFLAQPAVRERSGLSRGRSPRPDRRYERQ